MSTVELWWLSLAIAAVVVVVVAVLLGLIIATARRIDQHAESIWIAGKQIAGNTVSIWMLEKANEHLTEVAATVERMAQNTAAINETLRALATNAGDRR